MSMSFGFSNKLILDSELKTGALNPTGSEEVKRIESEQLNTFWNRKTRRTITKRSRTIYLIIGTGKAWAWHKRLKVEPIARMKMLPLESELNTGALKPTGSVYEGRVKCQKRFNKFNKLRPNEDYPRRKTNLKDSEWILIPERRRGVALSRAQDRHCVTIKYSHRPSVKWRKFRSSWWNWF